MSVAFRRRRVARLLLGGLLLAAGLSLVGRAIVYVATTDPGRPDTYRLDWGGPTYLGALAVHLAPAVLALVLGLLALRRRRARRAAGPGRRR